MNTVRMSRELHYGYSLMIRKFNRRPLATPSVDYIFVEIRFDVVVL